MGYLKAVLKKDSQSKIINLEKLISLGKQLNKDTTPDEKKLELLLKEQGITKEKLSSIKEEKKVIEEESSNSSKYSIKSIYIQNESIIIDFYKKITNSDISFFELNKPNLYKDVFDIKGTFEKPSSVKLAVDGIDNITLGQFKKDTLRVVLTNRQNLSSYYIIEDKRITIDLKKINSPIDKKITPKIVTPKYIDKDNSIRTIYTDGNQIRVQFNRNFYKKDLNYSAYKYKGRFEDVFDIKGKFAYAKPLKLQIDGLNKITVAQNKSNNLRIRISDKNNYKIFYILKKKELIIKINGLPETKKTQVVQQEIIRPKAIYVKPRTIVIDPGHGRRDVGAVGPNNRYEKIVTLKVSQALYKILKERGHKVFLTRNNDSFIKVNNRTILANEKNADIFISVHANSVPKSKAHKVQGIETFFLSPARSERAKRVAAKENKTDIRNMSKSTKQAFLESLNRPRITASHKLAIDTQAGMLQSVRSKYKDANDSGVREGPFWVLVGAQMPSILIELGYMSHPIESKRLYSKDYQELLAQGIANGIDSYFSKNP